MSRSFANYITACSEAVKDSNIPKIFRSWTAISAIAGALGRRAWYDFGAFQVRPNLYIVLIAGPGRGKSLSLILPIDKVFNTLTSEPGVTDHSGNLNLVTYGIEDRPLYLIRDRITPEKLSRVMVNCERQDLVLSKMNNEFKESSITLVTSEFGTLVNRADQYLQMFLTGLWDSPDEYTYRTKNQGDDLLKGPCLNWLACATPEQFVTHLPENARSQGLLSRIIPVLYDGDRGEQSLWYGKPSYGKLDALREDLAKISKMTGEFRFHDSIRDKADTEVAEGIPPTPNNPNLSEYLERRVVQFVKTAMCISAAKSDKKIITAEDWAEAKELMFETEKKMPEALAHFGVGKAGRLAVDMQEFLEYITTTQSRFGIPLSKFRQEALRKVSTPNEVEQMVKAMEDSGLISIEGGVVIPNVKKKKKDNKKKDPPVRVG